MAKQFYGISALTQGSISNTINPEISSNEILSVRVKDIILDDTHPKFNEYGGWNSVGTIFYDDVKFPFATETANVAIPLYSNNKLYPLINEIVPIVFLTSWDAQSNTDINQAYYLPSINIWNSQHHNALPDPTQQPPAQSQQDYQNSIDGSERDVRRVNDDSTDINLGSGFNEQINTHPLKFFAGDNIIEGRWGNSIRFGSVISNNTNIPITIIRNGQSPNVSNEGWVPVTEDINNDKSLIYLTDTQPLNIEVASKNYTSYKEAPVAPQDYSENQIILTSGRLLFNAKSSDILLTSNKSINLNTPNSVNVDTKNFTIAGGNIYLGDKNATEPILKGDVTIEILTELVDELRKWMVQLNTNPSPYLAYLKAATTPLIGTLVNVKTQLETQTKSKNNFTI